MSVWALFFVKGPERDFLNWTDVLSRTSSNATAHLRVFAEVHVAELVGSFCSVDHNFFCWGLAVSRLLKVPICHSYSGPCCHHHRYWKVRLQRIHFINKISSIVHRLQGCHQRGSQCQAYPSHRCFLLALAGAATADEKCHIFWNNWQSVSHDTVPGHGNEMQGVQKTGYCPCAQFSPPGYGPTVLSNGVRVFWLCHHPMALVACVLCRKKNHFDTLKRCLFWVGSALIKQKYPPVFAWYFLVQVGQEPHETSWRKKESMVDRSPPIIHAFFLPCMYKANHQQALSMKAFGIL